MLLFMWNHMESFYVIRDVKCCCLLAFNGLMDALVYGYNKEIKCLARGIFRMRNSYDELIN